MILNEQDIKRMVTKSITRILEGVDEEANPAFNRTTSDAGMKRIWAVIDQKQKELQDMVFGKLGEQLDALTIEKAKLMGDEHLKVPRNICTAGNDKLPAGVLIVNMSSSLMCPSFYLGLCNIKGGACYAQRDENQYTNTVLPQRFQTDLMHTQMLKQYENGNKAPIKKYFNIIELYINLANKYATNICKQKIAELEFKKGRPLNKDEREIINLEHSKNRITDVRLNETGDFHCQIAVDLWANFAAKIKRKYNISTHAYTARHLDFTDASKNINMNYSHAGDYASETNPPRYFKVVEDEKYNNLPDVELKKYGEPILQKDGNIYYYKCPCSDKETKCDKCGVCFSPNNTGKEYVIYATYHGQKNAKGLKAAFTSGEIKPIMDMYKDSNWSTDKENRISDMETSRDKLDKFSQNVERLRAADAKKKGKAKKQSKSKKQNKKKSEE